jgi:hypothetical protein
MKLTRGNDEYSGTPEDIAALIKLLDGQAPEVKVEQGEPTFNEEDFLPVIKESENLREQLTTAYPGVVPPKESDESPVQAPVNNYQAEADTGVSLSD